MGDGKGGFDQSKKSGQKLINGLSPVANVTAGLFSRLPAQVKVVIIASALLFIVIASIPVASTSSAWSKTLYGGAVNEPGANSRDYIRPETEEDEQTALWDKKVALIETGELAKLVHEAKEKEKEAIKKQYGKGGENVEIICESDQTPIFLTGYPDLDASGGTSGGEIIAQTAEKMAYPEGTPDSQRDYDSGARGTDAMTAARDKYHSDWTPYDYACCCHSTGLILSEALGTPIGSLLPSKDHDAAKKDIERKLKGLDFEIFDFDGKESSLQRGDVLTFAEDYGHTFIYLGNGKTCEGHRSENQFSCIEDYGGDPDPKGCDYFFVIRKKGGGSAGTGGVSSSKEDVINGACAWAEAIAANNEFHYGETSWAHKCGCYFCDTQPAFKRKGGGDWEKSYCCNPFVHAAFAHGGGDPTMLKVCRKGDAYGVTYSDGWSGDSNWKNMGKISLGSLEKGDVLLNGTHAELYIGDGKVAGAQAADNGVKGSDSWNESIRVEEARASYSQVIRYFGKGGGTMEIPEGASGASSQFSPKSEYTLLETIGRDTGSRVSIGYVSDPYANCAQSFAYVGDSFGVAFVKSSSAPSAVRFFDKSGNPKGTVREDSINHANGACATPEGNLMVAGEMNPNSLTGYSFSGNDGVSYVGSKSLPSNASSIAYDRETGKYLLSAGGAIKVYDQSLSTKEKDISRSMHGRYYQDIGAASGYVFACHTEVKGGEYSGSNYIDIYSETSGDYCGSYHINYGELESCDVVDGELVLLVHVLGEVNYIQYTGITIQDGGGGGLPDLYVTKNDLDIISAYNVTISNTGIYKGKIDKNTQTGSDDEDNSFSNNYRDITGRRLKLYWLGKNRGQLNYRADFKSKLKGGSFLDSSSKVRFFEAEDKGKSSGGGTTTATSDNSKGWNLILVNLKTALPDGFNPSLTDVEGYSVDTRIVEPLQQMLADCRKAGYKPQIISTYRSVEDQRTIYDNEPEETKNLVTKPGHSEHHTGLAVDILEEGYNGWNHAWDDAEATAKEGAVKWLINNCSKYGFILRYPADKEGITEIGYESWHFRYVGKEHAEAITSKGLCLEEYLETIDKSKLEDASTSSVSTTTSSGNRVIYLKERPMSDILKDMGLVPDEPYSGSARTPDSTTNLEATYVISDDTEKLLYIGMVARPAGADGSATFGNADFPIPRNSSWQWSSPFGPRWGRLHAGVDLSAPSGTDIFATCAGNVTVAGWNGGYGNCVIVDTGDKEYVYGHMSSISVGKGMVQKGQKLGEVGSTGNSTGDHLHYEVRVGGNPIDPFPLFTPEIQKAMENNKSADFYN